MITNLKYIQNIGRFETVTHNPDLAFKKLGLVFSENGRGKTTLCAILRSLTTGNPAPILERHRLSARTVSRAVVELEETEAAFDGARWNVVGPKMAIFDDHFVDTNVYSGLSVTAGNRQNLHELVIGEEGVKHNRRVQDLTKLIAELQKDVVACERAIPSSILGGHTIDVFCRLRLPPDLDEQLSAARKSVSVLQDAGLIKRTEAFEALGLPDLGRESIIATLQAALPELESTALESVKAHFKELDNSQAESWVSKGMEIASKRSLCPFCGQDLSGSTLLAHYQAYFSKAYADHKARITSTRNSLMEKLGGDRLARFQRKVQLSKDRHDFWSHYLQLPASDIDSEELANYWAAARDGLVEALDKKAAAPLETQGLSTTVQGAVEKYVIFAKKVLSTSTALLAQNDAIALAKEQASHGSLAAAEAQLSLIEAIERRHQEDTAAKCLEYLKAREAKEDAQAEKVAARLALDDHRKNVFGTYQTAINDFLLKFNADFRIDTLAPLDPRGVPTSSYELVVNRGRVGLAQPGSLEPSFGTVLSAGDRNTLALAFFFATLKERSALDNTIIVLDDPASSLDDGRTLATLQETRGLLDRAAQVIVLSHSRPLLCQLWDRADKDHTSTMQIRDAGQEASRFEPWNAEAAALTEYDSLHKCVRVYSSNSTGDPEKVAPALRLVLEGFLRVAFVEHFPPGKILKDFFVAAKQLGDDGSPIISDDVIDELDKLREYANQFHHDTCKTWQEEISNVNETQLKGFAKRVVKFTRPSYST